MEYREFLEGLWEQHAPSELQDTSLVLAELKLCKLMTVKVLRRLAKIQ